MRACLDEYYEQSLSVVQPFTPFHILQQREKAEKKRQEKKARKQEEVTIPNPNPNPNLYAISSN